jgi:hypothetical protein
MEDNDNTTVQEATDPSPLPIPQITLESLEFLNTTAKWTKFLAIMGFIGIGIMLLLGLFMGVIFSSLNNFPTYTSFHFPMNLLGMFYLILAAVYIFPVIYLNNFSNYTSKAVAFRNTELLTTALSNIKKHFKYMGILVICLIASYLLVIIALIIFTFSAASHSIL